jgi:hypothetical protein
LTAPGGNIAILLHCNTVQKVFQETNPAYSAGKKLRVAQTELTAPGGNIAILLLFPRVKPYSAGKKIESCSNRAPVTLSVHAAGTREDKNYGIQKSKSRSNSNDSDPATSFWFALLRHWRE